jgi:membrane protease YdiL (CAAX protease family)
VRLGDGQQDGPKLDMTIFVVGLVLYFVLISFYAVLPVPPKYSGTGISVVTYVGLSMFCLVLQQEYRPRAEQLGLRISTLLRWRTLIWAVIGVAFTVVELGAMYWFAEILFSTLSPHHTFSIQVQASRTFHHPFDFLISAAVGPALEELFCRGYLYLVLRQNWGRQWAAVVSSGVFAALHLTNALLAVVVFFASMVYVYLDNKARSLAPSIVAHASYNVVLSLLKGTLA